jgi:phage-related protein
MRSGISSAWNAIKSATSSAFHAVVGFIKNPLQSINLFSIGKNIIQGLINGIGSLASAVGSKIMSIAGNIKGKIQSALGIHSPSRFMAWVGQMTGQGLVNGIAGMQNRVASASQSMAQAAQIAPQQTAFSYDSQLSTSGLDSVQQEVTANMEQTELSKRPAEITIVVEAKKVAKALIDDINKLQGKQVADDAVFN